MIEFDLIKFFAIFLVLCGHSIMHLGGEDYSSNLFYRFISSFHMPLFMLVAGFFSYKSLQLPFNQLISKKFWQLIYPTITFGVLFFIADYLIAYFFDLERPSFKLDCFWFLKSCFISYLLLYGCLKLTPRNEWIGCLVALLLSLCLPFLKMTWMMPFFIAGYILSGNYNFLYKNALKTFCGSVILFILTFLFYAQADNVDLSVLKNELINGNFSYISDFSIFQGLRLMTGAFGSLMILSLCILVSKRIKKNEVTDRILSFGGQTLGIYVLQTFILETLMSRFVDLSMIDTFIFNILIVPIVSFLLLWLCSWLIDMSYQSKVLKRWLWGIKSAS